MADHTTRVQWADISAAARRTSEDLNGKDWVQAGIKARVLLADLADEVDRLKAEVERLARQRTILFQLAVGHRLGRTISGDTRESVEAETREVAVIEKEDL